MTEWIITSCVLILVVIILRTVLKGKISLRLQYALWALVLVRLLIPGSLFSSSVSVMNAVGERPSVPTEITVADPPGRWEYPGIELAPTITQTVDEQGNVHYTEDLEKWEQDKEAAWQEYKEEHTEYVTLPVADILRAVWYAGMAVMALWLVIGNLRFRLRITRSREVIKFAPPAVYVTEDIETPCLFGLFQPAIYVTHEVAEDKTALSHVLAHEETHYHHKDHIWALLRCVCLVLHWYNPLVWLAAALSRRDSELACDEGAIRRLGEEQRAAYGRTLIGLTCTGVGGLLRTATTMTGSKKSIKERIVLIAKKPKMKLYTLIAVILIAVIAAGCTFTGQSMDFPGWVATITVEDLDNQSTGDEDAYAYLFTRGDASPHSMREEARQELLTILQGIKRSDFTTRDPGLTEYGHNLSVVGTVHGGLQTDPWWRFTCLSDGMLKVECRDSMIAAKYGFREVQYLNCPALYSFIIEHAETYDPSTEQTDSQEEQLERLAQRMMEEHAETVTKELSHYFAPGEVQNVIPWRTGALKGSDFRLDVVKVEFYLLREEREGTGGDILRGDPVGYTRYLFLLYRGDSVTLLGHLDDTTISNVYGTPEMTDVSGDAFKAAATELYKAYKAAQPVTPEGLLEAYARDVADAHAAELTSQSDHTVVVDRINGLTPWRSEIAGGSGFHVDVVKVDYVLDHQRQGYAGPSSVNSTYESVYRYLFLLYQGDSVILLGHMDDTTVSNVYGTPEMTDQYGDPFAAAAAALYNRYLLDRAYNMAVLATPNAVETARYDLNGDGWDELIVKSGLSEVDHVYTFYAYRNGVQGAEPIGRVDGRFSYLARYEGDLIVAGCDGLKEWAYRVTWNGERFEALELYRRNLQGGAMEYQNKISVQPVTGINPDSTTEAGRLIKERYIVHRLKDVKEEIDPTQIRIVDYYGAFGDGYAAIVASPWFGVYPTVQNRVVDGVIFRYPDSRQIELFCSDGIYTLEEAFDVGLLTHDELEFMAKLHSGKYGIYVSDYPDPMAALDSMAYAGGLSITLISETKGERMTYVLSDQGERMRGILDDYGWTRLTGAPKLEGDILYVSSADKAVLTFVGDYARYQMGDTDIWWKAASLSKENYTMMEGIRWSVYDPMEFHWSNIAPFAAEGPKAAADRFAGLYGQLLMNTAPGGVHHVLDHEVRYVQYEQISTDCKAVAAWMTFYVLPDAHSTFAGGARDGTGEYEGWLQLERRFILEQGADGKWRCLGLTADFGEYDLSDFGYENGLWGAIYGNPKTYRCKETDPQKAAETLIAAYVEDLTKPDELRSFTITEYRNLTVFVVPTLEMSEADRSNYNYGLKESEIGENHWIVEFDMEYRWTGILHAPPAGAGDGEHWMDQVYQGSPVGFLLTRDGDEFILRSRYPDRY